MQMMATQNVVIVTHFKPDADALGLIAWPGGLSQTKGHQVTVITWATTQPSCTGCPGTRPWLAVEKITGARKAEAIMAGRCDFLSWFSSLNRIDRFGRTCGQVAGIKVMIDHHLEPEGIAQFESWNVKSASTAGLILWTELIESSGDTDLITPAMANCLYAGLMTDTGGFASTITLGIRNFDCRRTGEGRCQPAHEVAKIFMTPTLLNVYNQPCWVKTKSAARIQHCLHNALPSDELNRFSSQTGDTECSVNHGPLQKGIKLSVFIYDHWRWD